MYRLSNNNPLILSNGSILMNPYNQINIDPYNCTLQRYRIFTIGFLCTGTEALHKFFLKNNILSVHHNLNRQHRCMKYNYFENKPLQNLKL